MNRRQEQEFAERLDRLELAIKRLTGVIEKLDDRLAGRSGESLKPESLKPVSSPPATPEHEVPPRSVPVEPTSETGAPQRIREQSGSSKVRRSAPVAATASQAAPPPKTAGRGKGKAPQGPSFHLPESFRNSRNWLNLVGVVLLLLGVVFLFKYTADQGWLVPPLRVAAGIVIGLALLAAGIHVQKRHPHFSQVFSGAGIAALYITGFGAYALYGLVPYHVSFAFLASVSLVAVVHSLGQRVETLSLVGIAGALATPLLLHESMEVLPGVVLYVCLILAVASIAYLFRGWRSLLWVAATGGWAALASFYLILPERTQYATAERVSLTAGIAFMLLAFWVVPVLREVLRTRDPERWGYRTPGLMERYLQADYQRLKTVHVHMLAIATPLASLRLSMEVWEGHEHAVGWVALGVAAAFGIAVLFVTRRAHPLTNLGYTQGMVSMLLVSLAMVLLLDGDALFFSFVIQAVLIQIAAIRLSDKYMLFAGHLYFVITGAWFLGRLLWLEPAGSAVFNAQALPGLAFVAAAAVLSFLHKDRWISSGYRLAALLGLLGLLYHELSVLDNGQGYVTVAWGGCAVILLVAGLVADDAFARIAGLVTLYVVVGKLLLVDLTEVAAIWRILLFIGFGGMFLVLSYFYQSLWKQHRPGLPGARSGPGQTPGPSAQV
jgi:uncharacterized membrane protein